MAQNDMFVVMYKILSYLYRCMKDGDEPQEDKWDAAALRIHKRYWTQIMVELVRHGYVDGIEVDKTTVGTVIRPIEPVVTMEGVQFAQENSMMAKARTFLQDAVGVVTTFA